MVLNSYSKINLSLSSSSEDDPTHASPTKDIIINMDGGVGGSWQEVEHIEVGGQKIPIQQYLPQSDQQPFNLQ